MKLETGQEVKINVVIGRVKCSRRGKIYSIEKHHITIQFKKYKESVAISDIIAPIDRLLYVRHEKAWVKATEDMLQ